MNRRDVIKNLAAALGAVAIQPGGVAWADLVRPALDVPPPTGLPPNPDAAARKLMQEKIDNFSKDFDDDIRVTGARYALLKRVCNRLSRVREAVGWDRINLLSYDELLKVAVDRPHVGAFKPDELAFIDEIFAYDARLYGFYGEKVTATLTASVDEKDVTAVDGSGHFIFKGRPQELYKKIQTDVGHGIILTSGVRSVVKQLLLFLTKGIACTGNLSRASRSLAPPGYSFHGAGDFDVGKVGWGERNFSNEFARTEEFKKLIDLGYVNIRYARVNYYGVRFEPWHIKVA